MVVAERVIRVPIQVLPVDEQNGALDVGLCGHGAGNNDPAGALRRVRRGPIADQRRRAENRTSIRSSGARKQLRAVGSGHDGRSSHNSRSTPAAFSRPFGADVTPSRSFQVPPAQIRHPSSSLCAPCRRRHDSTASTLHGIADVFCRYLSERSRGLRIPGCAGRTYRTWTARPWNGAFGCVPAAPSRSWQPWRACELVTPLLKVPVKDRRQSSVYYILPSALESRDRPCTLSQCRWQRKALERSYRASRNPPSRFSLARSGGGMPVGIG